MSKDRSKRLLDVHETWEALIKESEGESLIESNSEKLSFTFFTMAREAMEYRDIASSFRGHEAIEAFLAVNDIITTKEFRPNTAEMKPGRLRSRIIKSLVVGTEQSFLLERGVEIIRGNERASIDQALPAFQCGFRLRDGKEYLFDFQFGSTQELGRRVAVLIGKNGSGKSQTLRHIAVQALGSLNNRWRGNFTPSRVIGFYSGHKVSKVFPRRTLRREVSGYKVFNMANESGRSSASLIGTLLEMIGEDSRVAGVSRFEIFLQSLQRARKNRAVSIFHKDYGAIDVRKILIFRNDRKDFLDSPGEVRYGEYDEYVHFKEDIVDFIESIDRSKGVFERKPDDFSSGEEAYVRFCIFSSAYTENGSLVLLDKPEVSLHPQFIDALMGALHKVVELTGSVAVVATHSAYVVRCVQEQMVYIIRKEEESSFYRAVEVQRTRMRTFGADVGLISLFVFGEDEMDVTVTRAINHLSRSGEDVSSLKEVASEDLISRIVNKYEKD